MKKILVTGGTGFIGGHVVDMLLFMGYRVYVLDRIKRNHDVRVTTILGDIRDRNVVYEAVGMVDGAINLAGILGTSETVDNPFPSAESNILGGLNFLEACRRHNVKGVQIAVGNHFMNNTYAISKTTIERFAFMYNKEHGTKIAVVRGLNAYGERQKHKPVRKITPNFVTRALRGEPIKVYGTGESIMDMVYVKDLAKILISALVLDHGVYDKVFSAGTGRRTTVNQIADVIANYTQNKYGTFKEGVSYVEYIPMRAGETEDSIVLGDPTTLAPLGIKPEDLMQLEEGMAQTIDWYHDNYEWSED